MLNLSVNKHFLLLCAVLAGIFSGLTGCSSNSSTTTGNETVNAVTLGRKIFFDENLSSNANQSCASCHNPMAGFTDPRVLKTSPVSEGSVTAAFGNRNAPTSAYASFSPDFRITTTAQTSEDPSKYEGGQFYDGRSSDLVEQAKAPFLNPVEMNNSDEADVVNKVLNRDYADDVRTVYGETAFDNINTAYTNIATAIAAFERSTQMNPFSSKFDAFMNDPVNNPLSESERRGFILFKDPNGAKCANCHTLDVSGNTPSLFTNFKYYNIGAPSNPDNPNNAQDLGLGAITLEPAQEGKFKVPTLRNIELTAPYMHNGVHETLEDVVRHYDLFGDGNIFADVNRNIASELNPGAETSMGLTALNYIDLVAFMKTLTDGYF